MATITHTAPDTLTLEGEIDLNESPRVRDALTAALAPKPPLLYIDLTQVSYMDSSGLAVLIEGLQKTQAYQGKVVLYGLQESVRTIFEIARLDQVFSIHPTRPAAEAK